MQIEIHHSGMQRSDALVEHINDRIEHALRHHGERMTHVEVHLHDDNAGKGGPNDKRCVIEVRPAGFDPIMVDATGEELTLTVSDAANKLTHAVQHFVDRHATH